VNRLNRRFGGVVVATLGVFVVGHPAGVTALAEGVPSDDAVSQIGPRATLTASAWKGDDLGLVEPASILAGQPYVAVKDDVSGDAAVLDTSLLEQGAAVAAAKRFVDLSWAPVRGAQGYRVFRDDKMVVETQSTSVRDRAVVAGHTYAYRVESVMRADAPSIGDGIQVLGLLARVPREQQTVVEAAEEAGEAVSAKAARTSAWVEARTFIKPSRVDAPPVSGLCEYGKGYQFAGDGRSYSATSSRYRTRITANLRFDKKNPRLHGSSTKIGATKVYKKSTGKLIATRTASASKVTVRELGSDKDQVDLRFNIQARDPFCSVGSLSGAFTMNVYKNGNWAIRSGSHRQMPHWEVYAGWAGGPNTTVYRRGAASTACLIQLACPETQMGGYTGDF
jgi:hypothetical protein